MNDSPEQCMHLAEWASLCVYCKGTRKFYTLAYQITHDQSPIFSVPLFAWTMVNQIMHGAFPCHIVSIACEVCKFCPPPHTL